MGWRAAEAASSELFSLGTFGGGFGATTVNLKGGLGSASTTTGRGYIVGAITVVNAAGTPKLDLPLQTAWLVPSPAAFLRQPHCRSWTRCRRGATNSARFPLISDRWADEKRHICP
jgi:hypothetical protein